MYGVLRDMTQLIEYLLRLAMWRQGCLESGRHWILFKLQGMAVSLEMLFQSVHDKINLSRRDPLLR